MKIAVVALGKIGLPLAVHFARRGHSVVGADRNPTVVDDVNSAREPFPGESGLADALAAVVEDRRLVATVDTTAAVSQAEVVVVVVPLFVDSQGEPDFAWLDSATRDVGRGLRRGTLVSFETTLPVGTTRGRWKPMLERASGLVEGQDFDLVFSPERVLTGRVFADLKKYPKLVGALTPRGAAHAAQFYSEVLEFDVRPDLSRPNGVWDLGSAEAAEMAKLAETTYRDVNIGLANQFALYASRNGIDVHAVIEACNSQPYSHIHRPGIAVGGHCIPIYPQLYLSNDPTATVVRAAREANQSMPQAVVTMTKEMLGSLQGEKVAVLGASYRGGVKETAFSGVFPTVAALRQEGAEVTVHDPMYEDDELVALGFRPHRLGSRVDIAILQADHAAYSHLDASSLPGAKLIVDGRGQLDPSQFPGIQLVVVGRG